MQRLEVSGAVRPIYVSLGVKRLNCVLLFTLIVRFFLNGFIIRAKPGFYTQPIISYPLRYADSLQQISLVLVNVLCVCMYVGSIVTGGSHAELTNMAPGRRQTHCSALMFNIYESHAKHELGLLCRWNCQVILQQFKLCSAATSNLKDMITLAHSVALYGLKKVLISPRDKATVYGQPP